MKVEEIDDAIMDFYPEAVVLDAGVFPGHYIPLGFLKDAQRIVCCDSAVANLEKSGLVPWRIVGDFDSIAPELVVKYKSILRPNPDQETNDQTKAVTYLWDKGIKRIAILGATGLREDHTLGNISLLVEYLKKGINARIYTDYGVFIPCHDVSCFRVRVGSQISIFNFGATGFCAEGLKYKLHEFNNWWEGTLNETTSSKVRIFAKGFYICFINYDQHPKP